MNTPLVVLITGCSSGFGRRIAETLAQQGQSVFASMRGTTGHNVASSASLHAFAEKEGVDLRVIDIDVTNDHSVDNAVSSVIEQAGHIDILINNAGILWGGITEAFTMEQAYQQMEVNFFGSLRISRAVLPHMRKRGSGLLIQISSLAGGLVQPFTGIYTASKMAVEALAESYRYELSGLGIDSIIIEPGPFATNLLSNLIDPQDQARSEAYGAIAQIPVQMIENWPQMPLQDPQEVADLVARLIAMPAGSRPLRSIAGTIDFGLAPLNEARDKAQQAMLGALGLLQLLSVGTFPTH